jgi:hypothetical protein
MAHCKTEARQDKKNEYSDAEKVKLKAQRQAFTASLNKFMS